MTNRRNLLLGAAAALAAPPATHSAAQEGDPADAAFRWAAREFEPSTLSLRERLDELAFFARAARPYRRLQIYVLSEDTRTHRYESRLLARAFREITGVSVVHDIAREAEVVQRLRQQRRTGRNFYDAYVNDADFIGEHWRYGGVVALDAWMTGEGAEVTLPTLDLDDFIGTAMTTAPDGRLLQLPDQQFAALYGFRADWFERPAIREAFRRRHGYALGVPLNWAAYEDVADFFTNEVREIDGRRVWGHMDYGAADPSLGWRFSDAWLAVAGAADPGESPVNDWGVRSEGCRARGASVARGGAADSPAAVYALRKQVEWLERFAPPEARSMTFAEAGPAAAQGHVAQQIHWYTAFAPDFAAPGSAVIGPDGASLWRVAPTPLGAYWRDGMKRGYQDCGAWTLLEGTPLDRRKAAWLYAQFCVSKTVSLKKTLVGAAPIRDGDLRHPAMEAAAPRLGGLVEFHRSPMRDLYRSTGAAVPDYAALSQLWWRALSLATTGRATPEAAMGALARSLDQTLARLGPGMTRCPPDLAEAQDPALWLAHPGAPWPKLPDERGEARTASYADILAAWAAPGR